MQIDLSSYPQVRDYLYSLKHRGANYGIERMRLLVERLGHPERRFPVVHIAGTNGKGSTCAMLEATFRAAGYRTGMFTSPHLVYQGERVQVNRKILSHHEISSYARQLRPVAEAIECDHPDFHPSFFEFMTAMAFLRFAEAQVDVGIIETGLGGRLDATNVVHPELSIITSIGLDHTEILGDTLSAIAGEKAGIIKPGVPVVMGLLPPEAEQVICRIARERGCPVHSVRDTFGPDPANCPPTCLEGDYQRLNAATVTLAVRVLRQRFRLPQAALECALQTVEWAGRWEQVALDRGSLIFDATHNPEGVTHLERNLQRLIQNIARKPIIVAGTLGLKRAESLMPLVSRYARELHLLVPAQSRACSFAELRSCLPQSHGCPVFESRVRDLFPVPAVCRLISDPCDVVVATGSIYLIGEIMEAVRHDAPVGESILQD